MTPETYYALNASLPPESNAGGVAGFGMDLARNAYEPLADVAPLTGDYRAAERGNQFFRQAYDNPSLMQKGLNILAGAGEYATTVPGIGELAGLAKMSGMGLGALAGIIKGPWEQLPLGLVGQEDPMRAPLEFKGAPKDQGTSELFDLWEQYDNTGELQIEDVVDQLDFLISDNRAPTELQEAVDAFRQAQIDDWELAGRGDTRDAERAIEDGIKKYMRLPK